MGHLDAALSNFSRQSRLNLNTPSQIITYNHVTANSKPPRGAPEALGRAHRRSAYMQHDEKCRPSYVADLSYNISDGNMKLQHGCKQKFIVFCCTVLGKAVRAHRALPVSVRFNV